MQEPLYGILFWSTFAWRAQTPLSSPPNTFHLALLPLNAASDMEWDETDMHIDTSQGGGGFISWDLTLISLTQKADESEVWAVQYRWHLAWSWRAFSRMINRTLKEFGFDSIFLSFQQEVTVTWRTLALHPHRNISDLLSQDLPVCKKASGISTFAARYFE